MCEYPICAPPLLLPHQPVELCQHCAPKFERLQKRGIAGRCTANSALIGWCRFDPSPYLLDCRNPARDQPEKRPCFCASRGLGKTLGFCHRFSHLAHLSAEAADAYNLAPGFILETVQAARGFLANSGRVHTGMDGRGLGPKIAAFLDWPVCRVTDALAQLAAIEAGDLSNVAAEVLPKLHTSRFYESQNLEAPGRLRVPSVYPR